MECLLRSNLVINNIRTDPGRDWSPLAMAVDANFGWDMLLKEGAVIDETCMSELENIGCEEKNLVRRFMEKITDINISTNVKSRFVTLAFKEEETGRTILEMISKSNDMKVLTRREVSLQKTSLFGQIQILKDILALEYIDIDFYGPETDFLTALDNASLNGHIDAVRLLLDKGAALEIKESRSNSFGGFCHLTAFMLALINGHIEVAMLLENAGADINAVDRSGKSALHIAVTCSLSMVDYILYSPRYHLAVSVRSMENMTALMMAVTHGDVDIARYILRRIREYFTCEIAKLVVKPAIEAEKLVDMSICVR
ncbi:hypothetical protein EAE96_006099 [Botrytis aclada]|nr:hypothetical protein EAE96_006099 [Botrytis aclada]